MIEIFVGLVITSFFVLRFIFSKEARLRDFNPEVISFSNSLWMLMGAVGIIILLWKSEFLPFFSNKGSDTIFPLFMSVLKGISLHLIVTAIAQISKTSLSSGAYAVTSGLPIGSLFVFLFLGEPMSSWDWVSVGAIGILSAFYFWKGHARTLEEKDVIAYFVIIGCVSVNMLADKATAVDHSWAVHLSVSTLVWVLIGFFKGAFKVKKEHYVSLFETPLLLLGAIYLIGEIILIYSMQNIFEGVVLPFVFIRVATPITMMIASIKYNEGDWRRQIVFGLTVVIAAALSVFL
jgi:hypothetical protein